MRTVRSTQRLVLLIVWARSPSLSAATICFRINASRGLTISVGPAPRVTQEGRRGKVHRRLPPAGPLHAEHAAAVEDHVADRLELIGTKTPPKGLP